MTKPLPRETATHEEDLPHPFSAGTLGHMCQLCAAESGDPRHVSWERQELASRERAQLDGFSREIGS